MNQSLLPRPMISIIVLLCMLSSNSFFDLFAQTIPNNYKAVWYDCSDAKATNGAPNKFMAEDNTAILDNLQELGCNTVFMNVSLLFWNETHNSTNLGLNTFYPTYPYKLATFNDAAYARGIKVYAVPLIENSYIASANHYKAVSKLGHLCYFQSEIRNNGHYPNLNAHFQGVVTNLEPWNSDANLGWNSTLCTSTGRTTNNAILADYLTLIDLLGLKLITEDFYTPYVYPPYTPQQLDGIFMGTVHWNWHYFSQIRKNNTDDFQNGNFRLYTKQFGGQNKFDIIIPETYCPKPSPPATTNDCIENDCIDANLNAMCGIGNNYMETESIGHCYQWFDKHYVSEVMYINQQYVIQPILVPIDAAPMLYGHSSYMFTNLVDLYGLRENSRIWTVECSNKSNYKGSIIWDYDRTIGLPLGDPHDLSIIECNDPLPDNSIPQITFGPNPACNDINFTDLPANFIINIYSFSNQTLLLSTHNNPVSLSILQDGIYAVRVYNTNDEVLYNGILYINR